MNGRIAIYTSPNRNAGRADRLDKLFRASIAVTKNERRAENPWRLVSVVTVKCKG